MKFEVYGQNIYLRHVNLIVAGTNEYLTADFTFSDDWTGLTKTVYFRLSEDEAYVVELVDDKITTGMNFTLQEGNYEVYIDTPLPKRITTDSVSLTVIAELPAEGTPFENLPVSYKTWITQQLALYEPLLPEAPTDPLGYFLSAYKDWRQVTQGSGGFSNNVYLTNVASSVSGYLQSSSLPDATETAKTITANNNTVLGQTYLFENPVGVDTIDSGFWNFVFNIKVSSAASITRLKLDQIKRHLNGAEEVMFTVYSDELNNTDTEKITIQTWQPNLEVLATDRMGLRVSLTTTALVNRTVTYYLGDGNPSYLTTPLAMRHAMLRDKNGEDEFQHFNGVDTVTGKKYILTITNGVVTPVEVI